MSMKIPPWHRTKIVCTLGPATDAPGVLEGLVRAGMDVARINLSHGTAEEHERRIGDVRETARRMGQPVAVLTDLPGPKFRLSEVAGGARRLEEGASVTLAVEAGDPADLTVRNRELRGALRVGESVFLADGAVELSVTEAGAERVRCRVVAGGTVRSGSGINVPESELGALVPTDDDRRHLAFALGHGVEWVGVSFVQSAADLARVRSCFLAGERALLMAKIEKRRALADLEAIVAASDGVMVARGDLGVETDLAEIPLVQKRIIAAANAGARPVITATQMLESMIEREHPTRAEVTDVANALLDGTDAVMLSGETAIGRHPVAAVEILDRVLRATEARHAQRIAEDALRQCGADAVTFAACELAARLGARAIIAAVSDFDAAAHIARLRPEAPLVLMTEAERLSRALAILRGAAPVYCTNGSEPRACLPRAREWLYSRGLARPGDPAVLLTASSAAMSKADTLQAVVLD
jgi:pyruvate kinase